MATALGLMAAFASYHEIETKVYNRVDVRLSSHDVSGITDRDLALAKTLDSI